MKKTVFIMAAVMMVITFSCSEDFLDKQPLGSTSETVFYNAKGIDALLIGTYGIISGSATWEVTWGASIQNWTYGSVASDDAYKGSEETDQEPINWIEWWNVLTTNNYPAEKWKLCLGMGVNRSNEVLRIISLTEDITDAQRTQFQAEARFLRAFFSFEAWLVFKNIPILTEETEDPTLVPNTVDALPFIIEDFLFAAANLPHRQTQVGRPNKWAAKGMAARAYLQILDYASAKPLLDDIINNGGFELMPRFMDNYEIANNNNAESIFEIQANVNDGADNSGNAEMGIGLNWPHGADIGMCCGFHQPSQNLVNAFKVDANGLPMFDTFNNVDLKNDQGVPSEDEFIPFTDVVDPRLDWTVSRRGIPYRDWGINRGRDWIRRQTDGGPYMPCSKPFFYQSERYSLSTTSGWMTGNNANNYRYLRLSHIYLWRAEVAASEGDLETACSYVDLIRARAASDVVMGKVSVYKLPPAVYPWGADGDVDWDQPAANYDVQPYGSFPDKAYALKAVQWELRLEFATEGHRFFDLRRWGIITETLNAFAAADLRIRPWMSKGGAVFTDRDKYQPIPQAQLDIQPGVLVQNPGY